MAQTALAKQASGDLRYCDDIGMFTFDRSRKVSCIHATSFCASTCFNNKLEACFKGILPKDRRLEASWEFYTGDTVATFLGRKRLQTSRVRFMSRGEAFKNTDDVARVLDIVKGSPLTTFWIPTRAWRDYRLEKQIRHAFARVDNVRILASTDPTTTRTEYQTLVDLGWSTMFYGLTVEQASALYAGVVEFHQCRKTHQHVKGACKTCRSGCFKRSQVHVHLKQH